MFFKSVGILWIVLGIWWIMRPQVIRRRFSKKLRKARRKIIFLMAILVATLFFSAAKYAHGAMGNIFLIAAIIVVAKTVFFLTSKGAEKIIDWWAEKPLWMWRVLAGCFVLIGILLHRIG